MCMHVWKTWPLSTASLSRLMTEGNRDLCCLSLCVCVRVGVHVCTCTSVHVTKLLLHSAWVCLTCVLLGVSMCVSLSSPTWPASVCPLLSSGMWVCLMFAPPASVCLTVPSVAGSVSQRMPCALQHYSDWVFCVPPFLTGRREVGRGMGGLYSVNFGGVPCFAEYLLHWKMSVNAYFSSYEDTL